MNRNIEGKRILYLTNSEFSFAVFPLILTNLPPNRDRTKDAEVVITLGKQFASNLGVICEYSQHSVLALESD